MIGKPSTVPRRPDLESAGRQLASDIDWCDPSMLAYGLCGGKGGTAGPCPGGGRAAAGADRSIASIEPKTAQEKMAATKFAVGKLAAQFEAAKHEGREGEQQRLTQAIGNQIGRVYRAGGDTPGLAASVIGGAGVGAITRACEAKATREYKDDPKLLAERQKAAETVAASAVVNGDAKKLASSMLIAHTYRRLAAINRLS